MTSVVYDAPSGFVSVQYQGIGAVAPAGGTQYLVQEEDGTSKLTLEEGGGSLLLEESS